MNNTKRVMAMFMSIILCISLAPVQAFAETDSADSSYSDEVSEISVTEEQEVTTITENEDNSFENFDEEMIETITNEASLELSDSCGDSLTWSFDNDGTLTISGSGSMADYTSTDNAPWYSIKSDIKRIVFEDGITHIGNYAFYQCTAIESVDFCDSINSIGKYAFCYCSSLEDLSVGSGVTSIDERAFVNCTNLKNVTIPSSVISIGASAFDNCENLDNVYYTGDIEAWVNISYGDFFANPLYYHRGNLYIQGNLLTSAVIPSTVTEIKDCTFAGCSSLTNVVISSGVTSISAAFWHCDSLASVVIPETVTKIFNSFIDCSNLKTIIFKGNRPTFEDSGIYTGNKILTAYYPESNNSWANYTFPSGNNWKAYDSTQTCGEAAYWEISDDGVLTIFGAGQMEDFDTYAKNTTAPWNDYKDQITSVVIEDGVTNIGACAFYRFENIETVTFGDTLEKISDYAFYWCTSLKAISLPESVTYIGYWAFHECDKMESFDMSPNVTFIGGGAFEDCGALTSITLPDGLEKISNSLFYNCGIEHIYIPESITVIEDSAFFYCTHLKNLIIPASVDSIGQNVFYGFWLDITFEGTIPPSTIRDNTFNYCSSNVYYPDTDEWTIFLEEHNNFYHTTYNDSVPKWIAYHDSIGDDKIVEPTCTEEGYTAFTCKYCGNVQKINTTEATGHTAVTDAAVEATCTGTGLTEGSHCSTCGEVITAQEIVPALGHDYQTTVTEPTCTEAGYTTYICSRCNDSYTADEVPALGHNYENHKCTRCGEMQTGYVDSGTCGENVFWNLTSDGILTIYGNGPMDVSSGQPWVNYKLDVRKVVIEEGITSISGFGALSYMTDIEIADSVTKICDSTFYDCNHLKEIVIPENVTYIGSKAFFGCWAITNVVIPDSVTEIGDYAFNGCTYLKSITLSKNLTEIGESTFDGCTFLTGIIEFPDGLTTIGRNAFDGDSNITGIILPKSLTLLDDNAFGGVNKTYVFYAGDESDWAAITINSGNDNLYIAPIHYNAKDHTYSESISSTCTTAGKITYTCTVCEYSYSEDYPALGHTEVTDPAEAPTCTETGLTAGSHCSVCGTILEAQETVTALGHDYQVTSTTEPTCEKAGYTTYTCSRCEDSYDSDIVPALGHNYVNHKCSRCSVMEDGYIASGICGKGTYGGNADNLTWNITGDNWEYTLTISGSGEMNNYNANTTNDVPWASYRSYIKICVIEDGVTSIGNSAFELCTKLSDITISDSVTSIGTKAFANCSKLTEINIPENLATIGGTAFINSGISGKITLPSSVTSISASAFSGCTGLTDVVFLGDKPSLGDDVFHNDTITIYYPSTKYSTWKYVVEDKEVDLGGTITWKADCTYGHVPETDTAVEPTCTETGLTEGSHCSFCGTVLEAQQTVDALGHSYDTNNPVYNWSEDGKSCNVAFNCIRKDDTQTVKGKVYSSINQEATCTEPGITEYMVIATYQGKQYTDTIDLTDIPVLPHTPTDAGTVTEPTCTEQGYTTYVCSVCVQTYKDNIVDALGHDVITDEAIAATCEETGLTEGSHCGRCGEVFVAQTVIDALGHLYETDPVYTWSEDAKTCTLEFACSRCNHIEEVTGKIYSAVDQDPTCSEPGVTSYIVRATFNGKNYMESTTRADIPALGHDWGDWYLNKDTGFWVRDCSRCPEIDVGIEAGDCDNNEVVNLLDLLALKQALASDDFSKLCRGADVNGDNAINLLDLLTLKSMLANK